MSVRWLSWINCTLIFLAFVFLIAGLVFFIGFQSEEIVCSCTKTHQNGLPKNSFEFDQATYENLGESILSLHQSPPTMQLPDLKNILTFYGRNGRPDADQEKPLLHFSFACNGKDIASVLSGAPLYLAYNRNNNNSCKYEFSPNNEKTHLWIVGKAEGNDVSIEVIMENEAGERISEPEAFSKFKLTEKEFLRYSGGGFDIAGQKVDSSIISRQKARWYGKDCFLEQHGGEEFKQVKGKQRIDFGEGDDLYSIFVSQDDIIIWDNNRWQVVKSGEKSLNQPLMVIKKIDERLLCCEIWDKEGKFKVLVNLLKSADLPANQCVQSLQMSFKFLGARTLRQSVFEINGERVILSPSDWLLSTPKGWKKLSTADEIDKYVQRKLTGALFVFTGMARKEDKQVMKGILYTASRTDCQPVEVVLQTKSGNNKVVLKENKVKNGDDDDDDEIDEKPTHPPIPVPK